MRQALRSPALLSQADARETSCGIVPGFPGVSPTSRQVNHVLLTRSPLYSGLLPFALDLHVLGTPPAFTLSQDQTLQKKSDTCLNTRPEGLVQKYVLDRKSNQRPDFPDSSRRTSPSKESRKSPLGLDLRPP